MPTNRLNLDQNHNPVIGGILNVGSGNLAAAEIDATSGGILVDIVAGGSGGGDVTIVGPLGQALAAASVPVVLTAAQLSTLTPLSSVTVSGTVGTTSAVVNVGQKTVNTTAVQISGTSTVPTNGIIIRALSTNSYSVFVGGSGVTTSNGFELVPGEATSFSCNLNTLYIISASSTTDKICWNVE